jgi:acetyl-CoA carboxylase carboxyltransferase component
VNPGWESALAVLHAREVQARGRGRAHSGAVLGAREREEVLGEKVTAEALGGGELHARISGVTQDRAHAEIGRRHAGRIIALMTMDPRRTGAMAPGTAARV